MATLFALPDPQLKVPMPGETPGPIVPEPSTVPSDPVPSPDPSPPGDPMPPSVPQPDPDRSAPIEAPDQPQTI